MARYSLFQKVTEQLLFIAIFFIIIYTVHARLLAAATIKLFQVLVRLLFKFFEFLLNKLQKSVATFRERLQNMCD